VLVVTAFVQKTFVLAAYPNAPVPNVMSKVEMDGSFANRSKIPSRSDCGVLPSIRRCWIWFSVQRADATSRVFFHAEKTMLAKRD
jgi:hypothetical protein